MNEMCYSYKQVDFFPQSFTFYSCVHTNLIIFQPLLSSAKCKFYTRFPYLMVIPVTYLRYPLLHLHSIEQRYSYFAIYSYEARQCCGLKPIDRVLSLLARLRAHARLNNCAAFQ